MYTFYRLGNAPAHLSISPHTQDDNHMQHIIDPLTHLSQILLATLSPAIYMVGADAHWRSPSASQAH